MTASRSKASATAPAGPWHLRYPQLGTDPLPGQGYISAEHFRLERERIFSKGWLTVGRVEQIPNPGD